MFLVAILLITGCENENKLNYELKEIEKEIKDLNKGDFNVALIYSLLDETFTSSLEDEYDYKYFGLTNELVETAIMKINKKTKNMYLIIKPNKGKKELIKTKLAEYFKKEVSDAKGETKKLLENKLEKEYEGYLIYVVSNDNEKIFKTMKTSTSLLFNNIVTASDEEVEKLFNIKLDDLEEHLIAYPSFIVNANGYFIVKPVSGKKETVKKVIDEYMEKQESQWSSYLQDQYQMVKNRKEVELGNYLIYIISEDNDKVLDVIKANAKE